MKFGAFVAAAALLTACQNESSIETIQYNYDNVRTIQTVEDIPLFYRFDRPNIIDKVPLLIVIDGSTCRGSGTSGILEILRPDSSAPMPYARLIVEKIGVNLDDDGEKCSDSFLQNYSIEERMLQHLRVLQHLRKDSQWWNGELLIWGWSDGGDIATQLTAYYPNTKRAVLGAMGGGITMAETFRDVDFCPPEKFKTIGERKNCTDKLIKRFDNIRSNPKWDETWLGGDNSLKVWETRLFSRLSNLLIDNKASVLLVHGAKDDGQIKGARELLKKLRAAGNTSFTYLEIVNMGHSPRNMSGEQNRLLYDAMRDWLLTGNIDPSDLGDLEYVIEKP